MATCSGLKALTGLLKNGSLCAVSLRLKQFAVTFLLRLFQLFRFLARAIAWLLQIIFNPFLVILKWVLKPFVVLLYGWYLKVLTRLKRSAFMRNKVLFIFGNRYFIHVIAVILTFFVAGTNLLQAKEVKHEEIFAQDSALYAIVNPEGDLGDEIVEKGIPKQSATNSYIVTDATVVATIPNLDPSAEPPRTIGDQLAGLEATSAIITSGPMLETEFGVRSGMTNYTVKGGDTVGGIAERFGVTVNTLLWANQLTASSYIRPGDTLNVPPASGILHTVKDGDTLEKIVEKYNGDLGETIKINDIGDNHIIPVGAEIIVVGGTPPPPPPPPVQRYYPGYGSTTGNVYRDDYYAPVVTPGLKLNWPVGCRSTPTTYWGHGLARDISCPMGTPIYAAESGTVYIRNSAGWGGGYGLYLDVVHGGGITTRYAHVSAFNVTSGQYVTRGQVIAFVGSTGRSSGPHLHFEVYVNGIRQEPLYYIQ